MLPGLFVTATDTGVGKTTVAAAICRQLGASGRKVGVLKPVASGLAPSAPESDSARLAKAVGGVPYERVVPIVLEAPLAPPVAARLAGRTLEWDEVWGTVERGLGWWADQGADVIVVEGVGGFLCPLTEDATIAELAIALDFPVLVVARRALGALNHTLLTLEAVRNRGLRVAGIVLNQSGPEDPEEALARRTNPEELARWCGDAPILAEVGFLEESGGLCREVAAVDWWGRAGRPRFRPARVAAEIGRELARDAEPPGSGLP